MSSIDVSNTINSMQNQTAQTEAAAKAAQTTTASNTTKMDGDMFLKLMLQELQNQDPTSPVDNKEFLAQQAQFTQVSETQEMNASMTKNNAVMQTLALVGKDVVMVDPNDSKKTITGTVTEASFDSTNSSITVGGKQYPLSLVTSVKNGTGSTVATTGTVATSTTTGTTGTTASTTTASK